MPTTTEKTISNSYTYSKEEEKKEKVFKNRTAIRGGYSRTYYMYTNGQRVPLEFRLRNRARMGKLDFGPKYYFVYTVFLRT